MKALMVIVNTGYCEHWPFWKRGANWVEFIWLWVTLRVVWPVIGGLL